MAGRTKSAVLLRILLLTLGALPIGASGRVARCQDPANKPATAPREEMATIAWLVGKGPVCRWWWNGHDLGNGKDAFPQLIKRLQNSKASTILVLHPDYNDLQLYPGFQDDFKAAAKGKTVVYVPYDSNEHWSGLFFRVTAESNTFEIDGRPVAEQHALSSFKMAAHGGAVFIVADPAYPIQRGDDHWAWEQRLVETVERGGAKAVRVRPETTRQ